MQKNDQQETVSVVIAAYNNPEYTRKTLNSIVEQNYRPIEVILSDDNSPRSLETLAAEFDKVQDAQLRFRYYRQATNLGVSDHFTFVVNQATGRYLVPMSHDNWFTDPNFIAEAVALLKDNADCYLCVANCVFEDSQKELLSVPDDLQARDGWKILEGERFIRLWRSGGLGWTQAYLLDTRMAHSLKAFEEPYLVNRALARKLDLADDTLWGFVSVLSAIGSVALTGKVVCVAGQPADSYSQSSGKWLKTRTKVKFIILYNISRADLTGTSALAVKATAKKQALEEALSKNIFDLKIIRHYDFSLEVIYLLSAYMRKKLRGALDKIWGTLKKIRKQIVRRLKAVANG